jgi:hypothetical protein
LTDKTGRAFKTAPGSAEPGEFFIVDRMDKSNYAAVYVKRTSGGRAAVTSMYPNARNGSLQVRIAAPLDKYVPLLSKANLKKLSPEDIAGKDGHFKVRIMGLDKEGASIVAESVTAAIEQGIIDLPESG